MKILNSNYHIYLRDRHGEPKTTTPHLADVSNPTLVNAQGDATRDLWQQKQSVRDQVKWRLTRKLGFVVTENVRNPLSIQARQALSPVEQSRDEVPQVRTDMLPSTSQSQPNRETSISSTPLDAPNITETNANAGKNSRLNSSAKEKNVSNALGTGTTPRDLEITRVSPDEMAIAAQSMLAKLPTFGIAEDTGDQHFADEKVQRNKQRLSDTKNMLNVVRDEKDDKSLSFVVCHRNRQPVGILALNEKTGHVEDIVTLPRERGVSDALIEEAVQLTVASGNEPILMLKPLRPELKKVYERWGFFGSEKKMYLHADSKWEWINERWHFTENARQKIINDMEKYAGVS